MKKADYLGLAITPGESTLDDPLQAARAIYAWAMLLQQQTPVQDAQSARALAVIVENAELLMHRLASDRYRGIGSS